MSLRVVRWIRRSPICVSSAVMRRETVDVGTPSALAARDRLPASTTRANSSRSFASSWFMSPSPIIFPALQRSLAFLRLPPGAAPAYLRRHGSLRETDRLPPHGVRARCRPERAGGRALRLVHVRERFLRGLRPALYEWRAARAPRGPGQGARLAAFAELGSADGGRDRAAHLHADQHGPP